jgi:ribosomal protein S9
MSGDLIIQALMAFAGAAGAYAAIKADLTRAIITAEMSLKQSGQAHDRLTEHVERHHIGGISHG